MKKKVMICQNCENYCVTEAMCRKEHEFVERHRNDWCSRGIWSELKDGDLEHHYWGDWEYDPETGVPLE